MSNFGAELNSKNLENKLNVLSSGMGNIFNELLSKVGEEITQTVKNNAPVRTGKLKENISFFIKDNTFGLTTKKSFKSNVWYSNIVEHGANIQAKGGGYLTFKINGEWKRVKSASVKPRPYAKNEFNSYFDEGGKGYQSLADELIKKIEEELKND